MGLIVPRRFEVATAGFDQDLQGVGSDAQGGAGWVGLRVPTQPSTTGNERYLFALCGIRIRQRRRVRLIGFRQLLSIGTYVFQAGTAPAAAQNYPLESPVVTPWWKFVDANVLWGIRFHAPVNIPNWNTQNKEGLIYRYSRSPSLLYESIVGGQILPPYSGVIPGKPLSPEYGSFYDVRAAWPAFEWCNLLAEGPGDLIFYASLKQTNPETRFQLPTISEVSPQTINGITSEDAFTANYTGPNNTTGVIYWRIGGSMLLEEEYAPDERPASQWCNPSEAQRREEESGR